MSSWKCGQCYNFLGTHVVLIPTGSTQPSTECLIDSLRPGPVERFRSLLGQGPRSYFESQVGPPPRSYFKSGTPFAELL